jgi:hypothetical protein
METRLITETIIVGISIAVVGTIVSYLIGGYFKVSLPPVCDNWNENYVMEISLFLTGVVAHLLFEYSGINKMYCTTGNACLKK